MFRYGKYMIPHGGNAHIQIRPLPVEPADDSMMLGVSGATDRPVTTTTPPTAPFYNTIMWRRFIFGVSPGTGPHPLRLPSTVQTCGGRFMLHVFEGPGYGVHAKMDLRPRETLNWPPSVLSYACRSRTRE